MYRTEISVIVYSFFSDEENHHFHFLGCFGHLAHGYKFIITPFRCYGGIYALSLGRYMRGLMCCAYILTIAREGVIYYNLGNFRIKYFI